MRMQYLGLTMFGAWVAWKACAVIMLTMLAFPDSSIPSILHLIQPMLLAAMQHLLRCLAHHRKLDANPVDENLRSAIRAFCTGLVSALNRYAACCACQAHMARLKHTCRYCVPWDYMHPCHAMARAEEPVASCCSCVQVLCIWQCVC